MSQCDEQLRADSLRVEQGGRTFVYVLPCLGEDLIKIGLTSSPVRRFRSFHPRFFTLFDLEHGFLVETSRRRDAQRMERLLIERWPAHRASAPLLVFEAAGGHTEWFRGIGDEVGPFASRVAIRYGYALHSPLCRWLHDHFVERVDELYEWSLRMLEMIEWQAANLPPSAGDRRYATALADTLEACLTVGVDISGRLPSSVMAWLEGRRES